MINISNELNDFVDVHCHIVPYVDDGAEDMDEAKDILKQEYSQGARHIVMTVHFRYGMFDTPIKKVLRHFDDLKKWLTTTDMMDMKLYISREYYCDNRLELLLDGFAKNQNVITYENKDYVPGNEILPFGTKRCILLEFSSDKIQKDEFEYFIKKASHAGLTPIIAHAERYPAVQDRPTIVCRMRDLGACIQVNCGSFLCRNRYKEYETALLLAQNEMVDIVSSDVHDLEKRSTNIKRCYSFLKKKYGKDYAVSLLHDRAMSLLEQIQ